MEQEEKSLAQCFFHWTNHQRSAPCHLVGCLQEVPTVPVEPTHFICFVFVYRLLLKIGFILVGPELSKWPLMHGNYDSPQHTSPSSWALSLERNWEHYLPKSRSQIQGRKQSKVIVLLFNCWVTYQFSSLNLYNFIISRSVHQELEHGLAGFSVQGVMSAGAAISFRLRMHFQGHQLSVELKNRVCFLLQGQWANLSDFKEGPSLSSKEFTQQGYAHPR